MTLEEDSDMDVGDDVGAEGVGAAAGEPGTEAKVPMHNEQKVSKLVSLLEAGHDRPPDGGKTKRVVMQDKVQPKNSWRAMSFSKAVIAHQEIEAVISRNEEASHSPPSIAHQEETSHSPPSISASAGVGAPTWDSRTPPQRTLSPPTRQDKPASTEEDQGESHAQQPLGLNAREAEGLRHKVSQCANGNKEMAVEEFHVQQVSALTGQLHTARDELAHMKDTVPRSLKPVLKTSSPQKSPTQADNSRASLPPGWKEYWSKSKNKPFYKRKGDSATFWQIPEEEWVGRAQLDGAAKSDADVATQSTTNFFEVQKIATPMRALSKFLHRPSGVGI